MAMNYIYAIIRGESNMRKYCERRFGAPPAFTETIGVVGPAKVYKRYWAAPGDDGFCDYYVLVMESEKGEYYATHNDIIDKCHELVRLGEARLLVP